MKCSKCGKDIEERLKVCNYCGNPIKKITISRKIRFDKEHVLDAIRKFEDTKKFKLGEKGSISKERLHLVKKPIDKEELLKKKEAKVIERFKHLKIPMRVPLQLPSEIIKLIKEKDLKKISIEEIEKKESGQLVRFSYITKDDKVDILEVEIKNKPYAVKYDKNEKKIIGYNFNEKNNVFKLYIPSLNVSLRSEVTKNQGETLYSVRKAIKEKHMKSLKKIDNSGNPDKEVNNYVR